MFDANPAQQAALESLAKWLAVGGLTGAGARTAIGAYQATAGRPSFNPKKEEQFMVRLPAPVQEPEPDFPQSPMALKAAFDVAQTLGSVHPDLGKAWEDLVPAWGPGTGATAKTPGEVPWRLVGATFGIPAAAYAGYKLADPVVSGVLSDRDKAEKGRAREEYYNALSNAVASGQKQASANAGLDALAAAFDRAYDEAERTKSAEAHLGWDVMKRMLWPLNNLGPEGQMATLGIGGLAAGLGAARGYVGMRDSSLAARAAQLAAKAKAEDEGEPEVMIAPDPRRTVPVPAAV